MNTVVVVNIKMISRGDVVEKIGIKTQEVVMDTARDRALE